MWKGMSQGKLIGSAARVAGRQVNAALERLGYRITRARSAVDPASMEAALRRAAERALAVSTVIDVGASDGRWSELCRRFFPGARYMLIEANEHHAAGLQAFKERVPGSDFVLAAAGKERGQLFFDKSDPFGGLAMTAAAPGTKPVTATTIDHEVQARSLPGPFLIKLDTHGFEIPIIEGASQTLQQTNLLIIEVYNFTLTNGALRFQEMCAYLERLGFRPVDLCDPMYRPKDGAFWQCDMFFVRTDRPEFSSNSYD